MQIKQELIEAIENDIDKHLFTKTVVLNEFIKYIFWHDYSGEYFSPSKFLENLQKIEDTCQIRGPEGETWHEFDRKLLLEKANEVRKAIGLKELKVENTMLVEVK